MGPVRDSGDHHGTNEPAHRPRTDLLALSILAILLASTTLLIWRNASLPSRVEDIVSSLRRQAREQGRQGQQIQRLVELLRAQVDELPTGVPTPQVIVRQQPGRTVVIVSSPRPSASPSPSPSPTCVLRGALDICRGPVGLRHGVPR